MAQISLDALSQRRSLLERTGELDALRRKFRRTESALESLQQVLALLPDPVEIIADNHLVHFANRASTDIHGDTVGQPYYSALLGKAEASGDCPVVRALRDNQEVRVTVVADAPPHEIVITPTTLASGQRAVMRYTRNVAAVSAPASTGSVVESEAAPAKDSASIHALALIAAQTLNNGRFFARALPQLLDLLDADIIFYYERDARSHRFRLSGSAGEISKLSPPPAEILGNEYGDFEVNLAIDAPYSRIDSGAGATSLPGSLHDCLVRSQMRDIIVVPARAVRTAHGAVVVGRRSPAAAMREDQHTFLELLSRLVGAVVERNQLVRGFKRNMSTVMELQRAGMEITTAPTIVDVFTRLGASFVRYLGFSAMRVRISGLGGEEGLVLSYPGRFHIGGVLNEALIEASVHALHRGEPEVVDADETVRIVVDAGPEGKLARARTVTVLPVFVDGERYGVVQLFGDLSREDIAGMKPALETMASHAAAGARVRVAVDAVEAPATAGRRAPREALDAMRDAVLVVGENGDILDANRALCELLGIDMGSVPRLHEIIFAAGSPRAMSSRELATSFVENAPMAPFVCEVATPTGSRIPVELMAIRAGDLLMLTLRDIRHVIETEEQLIAALSLSLAGERIANLAHQVNNYLTPAFYHSETLSLDLSLDKKTRASVTTIQNYLNLCHESILMVLQIIRPAIATPIDINDAVEEVLSRHYLADDLRLDNIVIVREYDSSMPPTVGYRVQLQQAIANVVKNAQEAMAEARGSGTITITTEATPATIVIRIADNGPGIPQALIDRIFDLGVSGKPPGKGTGVGLHFTRAIVERHRGIITVQNGDDGGAVFEFRIPVRSPADLSDAPEIVATQLHARPVIKAPTGPPRRGRILVVDDEPDIRELLCDVLTSEHHEVTTTQNATEAMTAIARGEFDCIICDIRMPEMDGCAFAGHIQRDYPHLYARLIFATGDLFSDDTDHFLHECGIPCIEKPFTARKVHDAVQHILARMDAAAPAVAPVKHPGAAITGTPDSVSPRARAGSWKALTRRERPAHPPGDHPHLPSDR